MPRVENYELTFVLGETYRPKVIQRLAEIATIGAFVLVVVPLVPVLYVFPVVAAVPPVALTYYFVRSKRALEGNVEQLLAIVNGQESEAKQGLVLAWRKYNGNVVGSTRAVPASAGGCARS